MAMENIVAGSSRFKEAAKRSSVEIEFWGAKTLRQSTIGVVVVSMPKHWCYVVAPSIKFTDNMNRNSPFRVKAVLENGFEQNIGPQDFKVSGEFATFYIYGPGVEANEMEFANVLPVRNEKLYLFCYNMVGEVLQPGNVTGTMTVAGKDYLKHDCPSPQPVQKKTKHLTVARSGEILLNDVGMLVGIVCESDSSDRTAAVTATSIRQQLMNNETVAQFKERIRNNA